MVCNKTKEGAYSEVSFECLTSGRGATVTRYRELFDHFSKFCWKEDAADLGWWCNLCRIDIFWNNDSSLIRHKQLMHPDLFKFPSGLSYWTFVL